LILDVTWNKFPFYIQYNDVPDVRMLKSSYAPLLSTDY